MSLVSRLRRRDPGIVGAFVGSRTTNGEILQDDRSVVFMVRKKHSPSRCKIKIPRTVEVRSDEFPEAVDRERLATDVIEVGRLRAFQGGVGIGSYVYFGSRAGGAVALAAKLRIDEGSDQYHALLASAHGATLPTTSEFVGFDPISSATVEGEVRLLLWPNSVTYVDAAVLVPDDASLVQSVLPWGGRVRGGAVLGGAGVELYDIEDAQPDWMYDAAAPSVLHRESILCRGVGHQINDVWVPYWGSVTYMDQIVTAFELVEGDSGTLLLRDGIAVGMLSGGTSNPHQVANPINFYSPIGSVLEEIAVELTASVAFV